MRRRVQLGKLTALGLKDARLRATKMAGLVADGSDPAGDRRAERDALTVDDLAEQFLTQHADEKRTGKRQRQALAEGCAADHWALPRPRPSPGATSAGSSIA